MKKGLLIVISGYSGVGKNTVIELVMKALPTLRFSVSCTTRAPRLGEVNGINYYFLSEEEFMRRVEKGEFVEHTRTFTNCYGTLRSEIEKPFNEGFDMILELNVVGAINIKNEYPKDCVSIFIEPPSLEVLKQRLIGRGSEDNESLNLRIKEIEKEAKALNNYDYKVVNNVAKDCADEIVRIIESERNKRQNA